MNLLGMVAGPKFGKSAGDDRIVVRCEILEREFAVAEDIDFR